MAAIANNLIHPALARRDGDARLGPQPRQGDANLRRVAAAHAVGDDVHAVALIPQVERRLGDADVALDPDEGDGRFGGQLGEDGGDGHAELGLVVRRRREQARQRGDRRTELLRSLRRRVHRQAEVRGELDELLRRQDAWYVSSGRGN